jgi:hypothetical protein
VRLLVKEVQEGVASRFQHLQEKKNFPVDNVTAGREYVEAYVDFIHYVERLHEAAEKSSNDIMMVGIRNRQFADQAENTGTATAL